ncbi:hypothetical protein R1flu_004660 [Riccia fluitans]|uniref:Uncharacterized protein n=1 Tax=Riccia fluitans TaxID=41844 RepID=A0ABD1YQY0_9MARC
MLRLEYLVPLHKQQAMNAQIFSYFSARILDSPTDERNKPKKQAACFCARVEAGRRQQFAVPSSLPDVGPPPNLVSTGEHLTQTKVLFVSTSESLSTSFCLSSLLFFDPSSPCFFLTPSSVTISDYFVLSLRRNPVRLLLASPPPYYGLLK